MSKITILHLSDIHFKRKKDEKNRAFRKEVQEKLLEAVSAYSKEHGAMDFVAVTGDIAFSGKRNEYDEALDFLKKLKAIFPKKPKFLAVPGNHDVDRGKIGPYEEPYYVVKKQLVDQFLQDAREIKKRINAKFSAFRKFCQQLEPKLYTPKDNYFRVQNFPKKNVSFLELNSCWASEGDQDRFNIALGLPQVLDALEQSKKEKISNRIALMHHPPFNWLKDMETGKTRLELFKNSQLLLHGHVHTDDLVVFHNPASSCICLGANASYTEDKDGFIGFQFLEVDFIEKGRGVRVKAWPYYLHEKQNQFVPDRERWPGQEGKAYFVIDTTAFSQAKKPIFSMPLPIPGQYRDWIIEFHSRMDIQHLDPNARAYHVPLPEVYIPIETANPFYKPEGERLKKDRGTPIMDDEGHDEEEKGKEPALIDIEELCNP